ncbi:probable leucine--tRNA ligase, mitochondrial [Lucilia sericata]|uniref:probable leucine--tRNA ligase, mitochondrial n=1 Tax=Lucilia sericata TaxID=13632 RepID=UPI0018A847FE|nr:probable leucine--tRNA ligase, mitochondrial [Lucilia sericata]
MPILLKSRWLQHVGRICQKRWLTQTCTGVKDLELTNDIKHKIEKHWRNTLNEGKFNYQNLDKKFYVLSMFPYPSGNLHMGHVRVYTISDTVARFQRMCGLNVFQPIGWDAFGLPAENAAIQRGIAPKDWTEKNIQQMKTQLENLGCSFDWKHELSTCSPEYYKWTQKLFLMLHKEGLAYQNEALVNWDPVDKTVLADEQVDANGCSWRSGAKVEKKLLKQWFIKTTAFAQQLLEGLDDPILRDWRDIINLQRHWIGECDGYGFQLFTSQASSLRVWTQHPEHLKDPNAFVVLKTNHYLAKAKDNAFNMTIENPFTGTIMPVIFSDTPTFADKCDVYLAAPSFREEDKELQESLSLSFFADEEFNADNHNKEMLRKEVLEAAQRLKIGGYKVSSKLNDWLISRQRYWGTPIPMINCDKCGVVPVPDEQLPVILPEKLIHEKNREDSLKCSCPKCNNPNAIRESDTMDTFVDSSWYYLRYLDPHNTKEIFDKNIIAESMPVDLYIGGKEHAVLHLYYARFMNHFLHSLGLVSSSEPFSRLLVQGMVMGRSFRVKGSGRYVQEHEVDIVNAKKNQAVLKETKEPVVMTWEKMSKSKMNGVDPGDMFKEYGTDTTRLIILADVAPTSHRNWSSATFPGILNWQKRLWLTVNEFCELRSSTDDSQIDINSNEFQAEDEKLFDARNFYVKGATFNYRHTHQLSVAISKMQGLTNSLRRTPKHIIRYGKHYERALAAQIIMLAPMAPHFASELWSKFASAPQRLNTSATELQWDKDVLSQQWPEIDQNYQLDLAIKVNGFENCCIKIPRSHIDKVTHNDALDLAFNTDSVTSYLIDKKIRTTNFVLYPGIEAILNIYVDKVKQEKQSNSSNTSNEEIVH